MAMMTVLFLGWVVGQTMEGRWAARADSKLFLPEKKDPGAKKGRNQASNSVAKLSGQKCQIQRVLFTDVPLRP